MRKVLSFIFIVVGLGITTWSVIEWFLEGMPLDNLWPYKNTLGTNVIHLAYIGLALIGYGAFDYWLQKHVAK